MSFRPLCRPLAHALLTPGQLTGVVSFPRGERPWPESSWRSRTLGAHRGEARKVPGHSRGRGTGQSGFSLMLCACTWVCAHAPVCMHVCTCVCAWTSVCACLGVCACTCVYVCVHLCVCTRVPVCACAPRWMRGCAKHTPGHAPVCWAQKSVHLNVYECAGETSICTDWWV